MKRGGYILLETIVAMGVLSIGMVAIHGALRQAILTRGQAEDYTTARFLLEEVAAKKEVELELIEGSDRGRFPKPYSRFRYEWEIKKVEVPLPPVPPNLPPEVAAHVKEELEKNKFIGKLHVKIHWTRAGMPFDAVGETLLRPGQLWFPQEGP